MFEKKLYLRRRSLLLAVSLCALGCGAPAFGQDSGGGDSEKPPAADKPTVSKKRPISPNATVNLVNLLVKQGVLSEEQAQALISQASQEAYVQRQAAKDAVAKAGDAAKVATAAAAAASPPGAKHVTYVPEVVKRQLREDIKREVMEKAEKENWASPGKFPEWAQRIRFSGDMRIRYRGIFFPSGNDQFNAIDFNAINVGSPYDLKSAYLPPTYNASRDRNQFRFRARLGMFADLYDGFSAGMRIATGDNNSPVSQNQTFASGGSNFSKYDLWIDRAYLKYAPSADFSLTAGRMDNPFWSPTDLVWYRDIGFDGFAANAKYELAEGVSGFVSGGAFPIFNTSLNLGTNTVQDGSSKYPSHDRWLFGAQIGVDAEVAPDYRVKLAGAYYDFSNVQGQLSSPCPATVSADICDTDATRPAFAQKGNTYQLLRNLTEVVGNNTQFEYFGLASQFRPVVVSGRVDFGGLDPIHVVLDGEYVVNTGFDRNFLTANAQNNLSPTVKSTGGANVGPYNGGNIGYLASATVGYKLIKHLWDWNVSAGYKYLESDAMVDAFVDSDFGLGGTNLKGYFVGGNLGVGENVWLGFRWMSANNIAGGPYAVDVLHVDLNGKF